TYENTAVEAAYRPLGSDRYEISLTVSTQKLQVDPKGKETPLPMNEWIDVGVYGADESKLIYLSKHRFDRAKKTLTFTVRGQPVRVGIDPLHKLIDRHANDNVIAVGTVVELSNSPLGY